MKWSSRAWASAEPSVGSVPAPSSSSRTSVSGPARATIRMIERRWPRNVDSDWATDCSSPMSAKTSPNTGRRVPASAGTCSPDWCIRLSRPRVRRATVLPPVFGPVMTSAVYSSPRRMSIGTTRPVRPGCRAPQQDDLGPVGDLRPGSASISSASRALADQKSNRARASSVSRSGGPLAGDHRRELVEDALDLRRLRQLGFAPGVAQLDGDQRLHEQRLAAARSVVDDALDAALGVRRDRDDVAAVAERDDGLLQRAGRAPEPTSASRRRRSRS